MTGAPDGRNRAPGADRAFITAGSALGGLAVALGAFGAHGLRDVLAPDLLATFETGVRYHVYHALALLALGALWPRLDPRLGALAGWLLIGGVALFSGSLYLLAITGVRWLGAITPLGGVAFIAAWASMGLAAWRGSRPLGQATAD